MKIKKIFFLFVFLLSLNIVSAQSSNKFVFTINGSVPNGFKEALEIAGQNWSKYLTINIPIKVNVFTFNYGANIPASAFTFANGRQNFLNAPVQNVLYPTTLANQLANMELNPGEFDMDIYFNMYEKFYYDTGLPPATHFDMITIAMHEMGHGLGFSSDGYVDYNNVGSFGNIPSNALIIFSSSFPWRGKDGVPCIYDLYLERPTGTKLLSAAPNNTKALADSIKNGPLYFNGPVYANAANGGNPVQVSGGNGSYTIGKDLLHLHNSYQHTIMSYSWDVGDTVRKPADCEIGVLKEIGWDKVISSIPTNLVQNNFNCYPNPADESLIILSTGIKTVAIYNLQQQLIYYKDIAAEANDKLVIETREWSSGMFYATVTFKNTNNSVTKKIIINH